MAHDPKTLGDDDDRDSDCGKDTESSTSDSKSYDSGREDDSYGHSTDEAYPGDPISSLLKPKRKP
jgi:hypothetical protein